MCTQKFWHTKCIMLKSQILPLDESDCCTCFNYFFWENRVWSYNYLRQKNCFYTEKLFYINFLCTRRVLQIFIGNSYPADSQLLCATVNFQNALQSIVTQFFFSFLKSPPFRVGRHIVFSPGVCLSVTKCVRSIT